MIHSGKPETYPPSVTEAREAGWGLTQASEQVNKGLVPGNMKGGPGHPSSCLTPPFTALAPVQGTPGLMSSFIQLATMPASKR